MEICIVRKRWRARIERSSSNNNNDNDDGGHLPLVLVHAEGSSGLLLLVAQIRPILVLAGNFAVAVPDGLEFHRHKGGIERRGRGHWWGEK